MTHEMTEFPSAELSVKAYNTIPKKFDGEENAQGLLSLCLPGVDITCPTCKKEVGSVMMGIGNYVITVNENQCEHMDNIHGKGGYFMISMKDIWYSLQKSLLAQKRE